jgi:hypothetical protein
VFIEIARRLAAGLARRHDQRVNSLRGEPFAFLRCSSWMLCPLLALVACGDGTASRSSDGVTSPVAERAASSQLSEGTVDSAYAERRVYLRLRNGSDVEHDGGQAQGPQGEVAYQLLPARA